MRRVFKAGSSSGIVDVPEERSHLPALRNFLPPLARDFSPFLGTTLSLKQHLVPRTHPAPSSAEIPLLLSPHCPLLTQGTIYPVLFALLPTAASFPGLPP